jgi:hypothetical protein
MANTIDFNVGTNATQVLNETAEATMNARQELKELQKQMFSLDAGSAEFQKAAARAGELTDQMNDAADAIRTSTGPALESMNSTFSIMSGQITNLDFGGLGQSFTSLGRAVDKINIKSLKDELGGLVKGFSNLAFSILSNPLLVFGAAVAALGYTFRKELLSPITDVIAANDKLRSSIQFTSEEIAAAASEEAKQISKLEELKFALNDTTTSTEKRKEAVKELQKINPVYFKDLDSEKLKYSELNSQIDSYINGLIAQSLAKAASARIEQESAKYLDEQIQRQQKLANETARLAQQQAEFASKSKEVEESGRNIFGGKSYGAGFERAKVTAAATGDMIFQIEREIQALNEAEFASKAAYEQRVTDLLNFKKVQEEIAAGFGVTPPPLKAETERAKTQFQEIKSLGLQRIEVTKDTTERIFSQEDALNKRIIESQKKVEEHQKEILAKRVQMTSDAFGALSSLTMAFNAKSETAAKNQFKINKAFSLSQAIINTYQAVNAALTAGGNPAKLATGAQFVEAGIALTAGLANVIKIQQTQFGGANSAGGGGNLGGVGSGGGTTAPSPANFAFLQNQPNQQPPLQAYVVSTQVSSNLEAQQLINNQARLGG